MLDIWFVPSYGMQFSHEIALAWFQKLSNLSFKVGNRLSVQLMVGLQTEGFLIACIII